MIKYGMCFKNSIKWETVEKNCQDFLHRKLNIDKSSVIIEGIVSNTDTWYIMKSTPALMKALNHVIEEWLANKSTESKNDWNISMVGGVAVIGVVATAMLAVGKFLF